MPWFRSCNETFALSALAGQFAGTADGLCLLARALLRGLLEVIATLHFAESAFPLHLLFQRAERLLHIILAHNNLNDGPLSWVRSYLLRSRTRFVRPQVSCREARLLAELTHPVHTHRRL